MSEGIGVTNLRLKYPGNEAPLLFQGISLSVMPGEKVLLLGPSGCGKSTLLQVLSGIVPDIIEIPLKADKLVTPSRWGYVFQDPDAQFCMPYVDEEIAFVLENRQIPREEMPERIAHYLSLVGLQLEDAHTLINQLSQGMKQRLAIASVLALEPEVLFLDEPTALLDEEGTGLVWETIRSISADKTLVIVEHKIGGILDLIDRLIVISPEGEILADGSPQVVFDRYKKQLADYGIWYPGVWNELNMGRVVRSKSAAEANPEDENRQPIMSFRDFTGLRGGQIKTSVDNLSVYPGDWIAIIGANGAGKSSLLLAIMRLIPTKGSCWIDGVKGSKIEQLAERVGFVFQNPEFQFVTNSVEEELLYSLPEAEGGKDAQQAALEEMLRQYDLLALRKRHPFQLSMGQKRRLSVASAMVRSPRILLLDEPTFGLDARGTMRMLEQLERLRAGGTVIVMVTHDEEIVQRCATRVWRVEAGCVTEQSATFAAHTEEGAPMVCK
ncbi:ABC transporter ATP-binding protein [Paenibacillus chondroitinus]|uniref:ABC transporter ATP-binding protein n=1 Tax=Paenibacillus chondroitinus TaxID=59842 RepID=A0ABU6DJW4_9BACL|nr:MULTISPECIES: ABC transporter ATP-binding protein [Paenibacillus]MCY9663202.1 energy-coupling factor ABC transporter ATP-binding protein [Paenibacillus anseongense]MEB4798073.1 ABC transporter ATP-binding protein [Paenibacillus chondroitinus]